MKRRRRTRHCGCEARHKRRCGQEEVESSGELHGHVVWCSVVQLVVVNQRIALGLGDLCKALQHGIMLFGSTATTKAHFPTATTEQDKEDEEDETKDDDE